MEDSNQTSNQKEIDNSQFVELFTKDPFCSILIKEKVLPIDG